MRGSRGALLGAVVATVVWACAALATPAAGDPPGPFCPSRRDVCVDRLIGEMRQNERRLGCAHNAAFALLYRRTTEGIRDAIHAGRFSDRPFWNQITTAFGRYYLDAFRAWRRGARHGVPAAWRLAFDAARRERVSTLGDLFLGINAHVNHDLAFVYARLGARDHADHLEVNAVLTGVAGVVYPDIIARLDPTLGAQRSRDPRLELDIPGWRELAWRNSRRLLRAPDAAARRRIAGQIDRHSIAMARRIRAAFAVGPATSRARDGFCRRIWR
jgi:Family of unknown function (DUF5995)